MEDLLQGHAVDGPAFYVWSEVPYVVAGEAGKLTSPAERYGDATEDGENLVAAAEGTVKAFVTVTPDAVNRMSCLRLSEDLLEFYLKSNQNVIRDLNIFVSI